MRDTSGRKSWLKMPIFSVIFAPVSIQFGISLWNVLRRYSFALPPFVKIVSVFACGMSTLRQRSISPKALSTSEFARDQIWFTRRDELGSLVSNFTSFVNSLRMSGETTGVRAVERLLLLMTGSTDVFGGRLGRFMTARENATTAKGIRKRNIPP